MIIKVSKLNHGTLAEEILPFHFGESLFCHRKNMRIQASILVLISIGENCILAINGQLLVGIDGNQDDSYFQKKRKLYSI